MLAKNDKTLTPEDLLDATIEELSQAYESLTAFYQLGEALIHAKDISSFIEQALDNLSKLIPNDMIITSFTSELREALLTDLKNLEHFKSLPLGYSTQSGETLEHAEPFVWESSEEISMDSGLRTYAYGVISPIRANEKNLGALTIARKKNHHFFNAGELNTIQTFADILGMALAQANHRIIRDEYQRTARELEIAAELQAKLLPLPQISQERRDKIFAARKSAREVGGDYVDAIVNKNGDLILITVDVMGKGVSAALLAGMIRTAFHLSVKELGQNLAGLTHTLNNVVCEQVQGYPIFATCSMAMVDKGLTQIQIVNAGHCAPVLFRKNTFIKELGPSGPPLGLFVDTQYKVETFHLEGQEQLIMVTDGLFEWDYQGMPWGWPNFLQFLKQKNMQKSEVIWDHLQHEIKVNNPGSEVKDDQTLLIWSFER